MERLIATKDEHFKIRFADEKDIKLILQFIRELADYQKLLHEAFATEETLMDSLFVRKVAEVIIGEYDGEPVGFALFFHNFSTFSGRPGIYLEDIYVRSEMRGKGYGKILLSFIGKLAIDRNCARFEWLCADWNKSSINFYKSMGADPIEDWTVYCVQNQALIDLANEF